MKKNEGWGPRPSRGGSADAVASLSNQRRRVFDLLGDEPVSIPAVAEALDLHVNTVREHLDGLVSSGLALRSRLAPNGRGRPAWGYVVRPGAASPAIGEYAALAGVLAEHVAAQGGDLAHEMERVGRGWGSRLMEARGPVTDANGEVVDLLRDLGFDPQRRQGAVRLRQCPMLDVARRHPDVVCQVHLGLVEGALDTAGGDSGPVALDAFAEPGACILRFE